MSFTLGQQELNKESECTNLAVKKITAYYVCVQYITFQFAIHMLKQNRGNNVFLHISTIKHLVQISKHQNWY